ncbi:transcriptional regulator [Bacillus thuringiensis serovar pingluonsis]|uniref:Transcriptional regulator n=1 Tax=Bacillus thuringiensis serovar pingluonsis TaxID=180881 RepID=A0A243ATE8_BACTU|nr:MULTISPECIES: helix-turn-helix transcriptional regulator [Bacillus cereus group]MBG9905054.1 XRE family transcriptional regulator [Bacillus paranthracis]MCC2343808.1 helix-turn-helix domain-containing protein [Bacillus anthracis]MDK7423440.1 helix-turn-helix transcriptional regulator [Bacillus paranthracis]MDK7451148.1 helix-turn-helix transcriptional regulator [Bacillus paranthracis]MDK7463189.1 helix-turn-helix transcriptional regulator [Bacillus paranthracis]
MNTFGENLKKFRASRSLTQSEFGEKVQLSRSQVGNLETNYNQPDLDTLDRIATYLGVSVDALMGRTSTPHEKNIANALDEIQTVFAGLDESQREQFCKQLVLYAKFLKTHNELL